MQRRHAHCCYTSAMHNARRHSGLSARARSRIRASRARLLFQLALATAGSGGVKIFEYEPGMIHAKIVIVDARYAIVGSTKFRQPGVVRRYGRWGTIIYWPTWLRFTFTWSADFYTLFAPGRCVKYPIGISGCAITFTIRCNYYRFSFFGLVRHNAKRARIALDASAALPRHPLPSRFQALLRAHRVIVPLRGALLTSRGRVRAAAVDCRRNRCAWSARGGDSGSKCDPPRVS
jgi:hypothetical protein